MEYDDYDEGPMTYSVEEARLLANPPISKNTMYAGIKDGTFPAVQWGRMTRVPGRRWRRLLAEGK